VTQQINLYNPALERKRDWLSFPSLVLAWGVTIAFLASGALVTQLQLSALAAGLKRESVARASAQDELTRLARQLSARQKDASLEADFQKLQSELANRHEAKGVLQGGVIGNTAGFSEYLRAFARQSLEGMWLTGFSLAGAGQDLVLQGRTVRPELVPGYVQRLNREAILKGHAFAELQMQRPDPDNESGSETPYIEFRLATLSSDEKTEKTR
jgi:hypothetical protein